MAGSARSGADALVGRTVSHYEVLERLGGGGMGVVYRARHTRLDREVALKFLPEEYFENEGARRRFEHEARTASAVNHPHICTVHEIDEHEGQPFIVMELLRGTLRERIAGRPLPPAEVVEVGRQLAGALDAAHARGVLHRDLKPANVGLSDHGVKILDFGLAKRASLEAEPGDTTFSDAPKTRPGAVLGTPGYMSPEQVLGGEVDARSDLFSLGVVLYELATRARPFRGESTPAVLDATLHGTPVSPSELNPALPPELDRVIARCLEKDRELRYQTAADLKADLGRVGRGAEPPARPAGTGRRRALAAWSVAVLVLLGIGEGLRRRAVTAPDPGPVRITPLTTDGGRKGRPRLSPDGERVAYAWTGPNDDNWDVWVKEIGPGTRPLRLTDDPAPEGFPSWSPDGKRIVFSRDGEGERVLLSAPASGGQERVLTTTTFGFPTTAWSPDGDWLAFTDSDSPERPNRILRLSLETLERAPLTSPPPGWHGDFEPSLSPDGRRVAFIRSPDSRGPVVLSWVVVAQALDGGEPRELATHVGAPPISLAWTADSSDVVYSVYPEGVRRVSASRGGPEPVPGLGRSAESPTIAGDRLVFAEVRPIPMDLWRMPIAPGATGPPAALAPSGGDDWVADYSSDGTRIAFQSSRSGVVEVWVCDAGGGDPVQVTDGSSVSGSPKWSPDGRQLAFDSLVDGQFDVYVVSALGGIPRRLTQEPSNDNRPSWSHDGAWIYFTSDRSGSVEVWRMPASGGPARQLTRGGGADPVESGDGRHLYFWRRGAGLWRMPAGGGDAVQVVETDTSDWALGTRHLYYATSEARVPQRRWEVAILALDLESGAVGELLREERPARLWSLAVSPGEEWLLFGLEPAEPAELLLVEGFR